MKLVLLCLLAAMLCSCQQKLPRGSALFPSEIAALDAAPTVTLFWTNAPMTNLVINLRAATSLSTPRTNWVSLGNFTGASAVAVPITSDTAFFRASIAGQYMTLAWDYPVDLRSPDLWFNLYWRPDAASAWVFATNVPSSETSVRFLTTINSGWFALTASNSTLKTESDFSNIVDWTNSVGSDVRLQIGPP